MISSALNKTWQQLLHPAFRKVFIIGTTLSLFTLIILMMGFVSYWPEGVITGIDWIDSAIIGVGAEGWAMAALAIPMLFVVFYFLFPPIARVVMGIMTDDIMDAVEEDYYPHNLATREISNTENVIHALKFGIVVLVVNLIALIPYILLLMTGFGTIILYLLINGYLIGREYMESAALRHMPAKDVKIFRNRHRGKMMMGGMANAAMFLIPVLNIAAPIIGTAIMTHITQMCMEQDKYSRR